MAFLQVLSLLRQSDASDFETQHRPDFFFVTQKLWLRFRARLLLNNMELYLAIVNIESPMPKFHVASGHLFLNLLLLLIM